MAEFSPQELDLLEDALEDFEDVEDLSSLGLPAALTERLGEYRDLLAASREAMPMEEVPEGLLDGVYAEAREAKSGVAREPGFWERWRRTLIPAFALAGTAVAVLLIVRPDRNMEDAIHDLPPESTIVSEDDARAGQEAPTPATATPGAASPALPEEEPPAEEAEDDEGAAFEPQAQPAPSPEAVEVAPAKQSKKSGAKMDWKPSEPEPDQAAEKLSDKDAVWELIDRADSARNIGDCDSARQLYQRALDSAPNGKARAKVLMGLGLCEEQFGNDSSQFLQDAQAADPSIATEIQSARDAMRSASKKGKPKQKKAKSKASPKTQNAYPGD